MKIVILRKSNQLGATANIIVKGMSQIRYNFVWDKQLGSYAYEPRNQKEADDIFLTQGKIYRHMFFGIVMDKPYPEERIDKRASVKKALEAKKKKKPAKQPVDKEVLDA